VADWASLIHEPVLVVKYVLRPTKNAIRRVELRSVDKGAIIRLNEVKST